MNTLSPQLHEQRILSVSAHPDDVEMHHTGLLSAAAKGFAYIASDGEGTTLNYNRSSLC